MKYEEALKVIGDLTKFGINLGLQRISNLLDQVNNPQDRLSFIHVGGTNGKGSTAAVISAVLREAGYRVGVYTSPHLCSYTERIMINGTNIPPEEFAGLLAEVMPCFKAVKEATGEHPTEFEVLTVLAFLYFFRQQVDLVVLEVGLGGDIDSTNVIRNPLLSVITNVSIEHTAYLGRTLEEIAHKKSGIIKKGCPVITASDDIHVLEVLRQEAEKKKAPLREVFREMTWEIIDETIEGQTFLLRSRRRDYGRLFLPLLGEHQIVNTATALLALEEFNNPVSTEHIMKGLAAVKWPGRLEVLGKRPLVVVDGAHNPAGMEALSRWLRKQRPQFNKVILVVAMLADKDRRSAVQHLDGLADRVIVTSIPSPRAGSFWELQEYFRHSVDKTVIADLPAALKAALADAGPKDLVLVTGSLYLIGEARRLLV